MISIWSKEMEANLPEEVELQQIGLKENNRGGNEVQFSSDGQLMPQHQPPKTQVRHKPT